MRISSANRNTERFRVFDTTQRIEFDDGNIFRNPFNEMTKIKNKNPLEVLYFSSQCLFINFDVVSVSVSYVYYFFFFAVKDWLVQGERLMLCFQPASSFISFHLGILGNCVWVWVKYLLTLYLQLSFYQ